MAPNPTPIFHITPIENLPRILKAGELQAKQTLDQKGTAYTNIAHQTIQDHRFRVQVPCGPGGVLHDYVPFYFGPRSPMLYTISKGNVEGFAGGQQSIIHLIAMVQSIQKAGLGFVFTDGHGIMELTSFYDDLAKLDEIDWPLMKESYWADTDDDPDRKRRRQAEFLVHERCPVNLLQGIGVINQQKKAETEALLAGFELTMQVVVRRNWYY